MFLTVTSLWMCARFYEAATASARDVWALSFVNLLLVYTQYYGWLVVVGELLILLVWERSKLAGCCGRRQR